MSFTFGLIVGFVLGYVFFIVMHRKLALAVVKRAQQLEADEKDIVLRVKQRLVEEAETSALFDDRLKQRTKARRG